MLTKIKTFFDQLYFGFVSYGKNYYSDEFSKFYGETLLFICDLVILIPIAIFLGLNIKPITDPLIQHYIHEKVDSIIIVYVFVFIFLLIQFVYLHYKKRTIKIIEKYKELDGKSIKKIKHRSGYFAVFSFVWFFIGAIILFIYSQNKF